MFKRIVLLLCIAYVVICFGFPFFALPFGTYTYSGTVSVFGTDVECTYTYKFEFNGTGTSTTKQGDTTTTKKFTYRNAGNKVIIKEEDATNEYEVAMGSMYTLTVGLIGTTLTMRNDIGMWISIGVGVLAVVVVLLPNKRA